MPARAVLWDIDGTLLDSEGMHFTAIEAVSVAAGHRLDPALHATFLGRSMAEAYRAVMALTPLPLSFERWIDAVNDHYVARVDTVQPLAGALELVGAFGRHGLRQACVSNSDRRIVAANFRHLADGLGLGGALEFAISRDDLSAGKPDPEGYLLAARRLGVAPALCVVIEDSPPGAAAGVAAGMTVVACPQDPRLTFDGVAAVVRDLAEADWAGLLGISFGMQTVPGDA